MQPKFNPDIDFFKEELDERIIEYLSELKALPLDVAMDIYYRSQLSKQIDEGQCGIENLDYKYLVEDLVENEPSLFV